MFLRRDAGRLVLPPSVAKERLAGSTSRCTLVGEFFGLLVILPCPGARSRSARGSKSRTPPRLQSLIGDPVTGIVGR